MAKVVVTLTRTKETKGTVVFGTEDEQAAVKTVYVTKGTGFDKADTLTLTLEAA